jgi:hypothetical protein
LSLPSGPTAATDLRPEESGSAPFSFFSRTIERDATVRAAAMSSGRIVFSAIFDWSA